jgi:predicted dehydrogenase
MTTNRQSPAASRKPGTTTNHRRASATPRKAGASRARVRYAVVGLGYIAQNAVLPAFRNARRNSELAALVSGSDEKLTALQRKYRVPQALTYDHFDRLIRSGDIDAVYVALPNDLHHDCVLRAAAAGVHVLCEKPLALTERQCEEMIGVARRHDVRLMTAYRLHFDSATLRVIEMVREGRIGEPRFFTSSFSMQVTDRHNIRLSSRRGGGPLYDLGIYCINAARSIFRNEPEEVFGLQASAMDPRFREVEEMTFGTLRFPGQRVATFACSFGAADTSTYQIVGTRGDIRVDPGYEYAEGLAIRVTVDGKTRRYQFKKRDQFAPELLEFSRCVLEHDDPEPSGFEGLADVRVIQAMLRSAANGRAVHLPRYVEPRHPRPDQEIHRPPIQEPELVAARPPGS